MRRYSPCAACTGLALALALLPWATGFAPSKGAWHGLRSERGQPACARALPALRRRGTRAFRATAARDDEAPKALVSPIAGASVSPDGFVSFLSYTAAGR